MNTRVKEGISATSARDGVVQICDLEYFESAVTREVQRRCAGWDCGMTQVRTRLYSYKSNEKDYVSRLFDTSETLLLSVLPARLLRVVPASRTHTKADLHHKVHPIP